MTKVVSALTARTQLGAIMQRATVNQERFIVDRRGEPQVVILSVQAVAKVLHSRKPRRKGIGERLYVIHGFTYDGILVYTKGKLHRESGQEVYYVLISSKRAVEG